MSIDDEEYVEKVTEASAKLLQAGKLKSLDSLRAQVRNGSLPSSWRRCPTRSWRRRICATACGRARWPSAATTSARIAASGTSTAAPGFVVGEGGIICTCCHVVQAEDEGVKESYLIAADDAGRVFPVQSVLAADTESDTCFVKIDAPGLKPLPLRTGVRTGERVYCLSHPGGYYFMFTQGHGGAPEPEAQRGPG